MSTGCFSSPISALLLASALLGSTTVFAEPLRLEAEEYASTALVRLDETASDGAYVSRVNPQGDPVARLLKFSVPEGLGEVRIWLRGRLLKGVLEIRSNEVEEEIRTSRSIASETRRESPRIRFDFGGDPDTWEWIDLGVHDVSDSAAIVPWAHEDPGTVPESGIDCIILSADLDFDPAAEE